jgi:uncharacterized membrane protein YdjX (TVP38/TMEM64 family)
MSFLDWVGRAGFWGPLALAAFYVAACVLLIPGTVFTMAAGFLFGVPIGVVTASLGSTLGACAAFLVGRTVAGKWIERRMVGFPAFRALREAVGREGFKIVLLTRLSPVFPFNLINYAFGITTVSLRDYALGSWIGMLPGTVLFVYLGSAAKSLAELGTGRAQGGTAQHLLFGVGLAATLAVAWVVGRAAKKAMQEVVPAGSTNGGKG